MKFASVRLVTNDIDRLMSFYATLTGVAAARLAPDFAEVRVAGIVLAIASERSIKMFNAGAATAADNHSAILEFQVDDVDRVRDRLSEASVDLVMAPTDQPWGNRSMLLRDPDGNLINIFAPISRKS
jgi:uncharacterized glyoxalase superfamily protein PhnB